MPRQPHAEHLVVPVQFKAVDEEQGIVEGHASVFGNIDSQDGIVHRGAFKKTITERVPKRLVKFMDSHVYDIAHTLGTVTWAEEDGRGLRFRAQLSHAPSVQDVRQKLLEGHIDRLSIGYDPVQEDFETKMIDGKKRIIRHLRQVKLYEISAVPLAANEEARILTVKAVVPFQDLPLADREREWDSSAAESRVRQWAGGGESLDDMNWSRYRRAFVWYDTGDPQQVGSYKLPIADVIEGTLTAVPRAVFAAAAAVQGARGGVDIPEGDVSSVRGHLERYYAKLREATGDDSLIAPWNQSGASPPEKQSSGKSTEDLEAAFEAAFSRLGKELRKELGLDAGPGAAPPTSPKRESSKPSERKSAHALRARAMELEMEIHRRAAT